MVLGGKSSLLHQCNCSILLFLTLHISRDHPMVPLRVKPVFSRHLALFHHQANWPIRHNLVFCLQANRPIRYNLGLIQNQASLLNWCHLFIQVNLFI